MKYENLSINDLLVWSENPRLNLEASIERSEAEIINLLIEVVGYDKMYKIAEDIFKYGLAGNHLVLVVEKENRYLVFDGNRRVSSIKFLNNPEIIEDSVFRQRIISLKERNANSSKNNENATIYCAIAPDEKEAHRLMDLEHMGEQEGKGTIPWDSYAQDDVRVKRGFPALMPISYFVYNNLKLTKSDFRKLAYTDINRIFAAKKFKEAFGIIDYMDISDDNISRIKEGYRALLEYKKVKKFKSFSRRFDVITESSDGRNPLADFIEWYNENSKYDYYITFKEDLYIYHGEQFKIADLNVKVTDKNRKAISDANSELVFSYISPDGTKLNSINSSLVGTWTVEITYKNRTVNAHVEVKKLVIPKIDFYNKITYLLLGKSLDLATNIRGARGVRNQQINQDLINFEVINSTMPSPKISGRILEGNNEEGSYIIQASFKDGGLPVSDIFTVNIIKEYTAMTGDVKEPELLVTDFGGINSKIDFNPTVAKLINEINELDFNKFEAVIFCSIRTLVEFSLLSLVKLGKINFNSNDSLIRRLSIFANFLTTGGIKSILSIDENALIDKNAVSNWWKNSDNINNLSVALNEMTHRSNWSITNNDFKKYCRNGVSQLLYITDFFYKNT